MVMYARYHVISVGMVHQVMSNVFIPDHGAHPAVVHVCIRTVCIIIDSE